MLSAEPDEARTVVIEHRALDALFRAFTDGDVGVVPELCRQVERHVDRVESQVLPGLRGAEAASLRADVEALRRQVALVRRGRASSHAWLADVVRLMELERAHVVREERVVLTGHGPDQPGRAAS